MGALVMAKLIDRISEVAESEEEVFAELPTHTDCTGITDKSARFNLNGRTFFLPLIHIRHIDGMLYGRKWLLEKEGLLR